MGLTDTQSLTNKTLDGVTASVMAFVDATSSIQTQLNSKAALASPTFTGTPAVPTAIVGTNTTQAASTAYVMAALPTVIANVTVTLPTTSIAANTCTTAATVTMTGLATTSVLIPTFASNPTAVTGWGTNGGLTFEAWPTANTLNWSVCNQTSAAITGGTMSLNVGGK